MSKHNQGFSAFTKRFNGRTSVLPTKIRLSTPFNPKVDKISPPPLTECNAIWDTGASMSTITKSAARKLGLKPTGKVNVSNTSGNQIRDTYLINIYLPNKVAIPYVRVVECESLVGDFEFLVGMDIIGHGDFSITNVDGKTVMSYRIPSIKEVDYVKEAKRMKDNLKTSSQSRQKTKEIKKRREKEKARRKASKKNRKHK